MKSTNLAVVAILVHQDKCLFLKRHNPPLNWCPPAGRLLEGEDPALGLLREIFEETGLKADVILPVSDCRANAASVPRSFDHYHKFKGRSIG
ncbi:MAG: RNA pyrophosphohydrolase [Chlamydiae bacterium]|nr:RNA pyrophosphohydrolase [Chlamydiota bacterium]